MNPNNQTNQVPMQQPVAPQMPQAPQPAVSNETVQNLQGGGKKKYAILGVLLGLLVVVIVGVAGYYYLYSPKNNVNTAAVPTKAPVAVVEEEVADIKNDSELDSIINELSIVDEALANELKKFETESSF